MSSYDDMINKYPDRNPLPLQMKSIIACLRRLYPSTYDFRAAKEYYDIYNLNRMQAEKLKEKLKDEKYELLQQNREKYIKSKWDSVGARSQEEYFEKCGWEKNKDGVYVRPKKEISKDIPNVIKKFNIERYDNAKRVGYRGNKKNIE